MWLFKKQEHKSDEELIALYKQSQDKALVGELFKKHVSSVYGTCLFYLKDKEEAQDAVMQIFEKLMVELLQREVENFKAWLGFVVRNFCISLLRKKQSHWKQTQAYYEFEYEDPLLEKEESIHRVSDELMLQYMQESLPELKEKQRLCVELFYLKNKSYQEIAAQTGYQLNEVKSYIQNGKRNLKLLIEEKLNQPRRSS